jgi:hypothetical protein
MAYTPFPSASRNAAVGPADRFPAAPYVRTRVQIALSPPRRSISDGFRIIADGYRILAGDSGFLPVQFTPGLVTEQN